MYNFLELDRGAAVDSDRDSSTYSQMSSDSGYLQLTNDRTLRKDIFLLTVRYPLIVDIYS